MRRILVELHLDMPDQMSEETQVNLVTQIAGAIPAEFKLVGYEQEEYAVVANSAVHVLPLNSKMKAVEIKNPFEGLGIEATKIGEEQIRVPVQSIYSPDGIIGHS